MDNPWKSIPLKDYEGHMALPAIGQAEMLAGEFGDLLRDHPAEAVAVVGCAGGNGFEEAAKAGVARLVGLDINESFIAEAGARFSPSVPGLELHCADIQAELPPMDAVELVFAALVFEYVDIHGALRNIRRMCGPRAVVCALLQLPKPDASAVSASPYASLQGLGAIMRLVPPSELRDAAEGAGFAFMSERAITLRSGKCFAIQLYRAREGADRASDLT